MATAVGYQQSVPELLAGLIELDYDAIEAYRAAVERLEDTTFRTHLAGFRQDHERHVQDVGARLRALGGEVPDGPDIKQILTKGKVVIAGLLGDHAILLAMKTNEDDTNTAYERAAARTDLTADLREVLQANLADERRHRAWIEEQIALLSARERDQGKMDPPLQ